MRFSYEHFAVWWKIKKNNCLTVLKITKPKLAVNEECEDFLSCDDELNEVVVWGMSRLLLGAVDEERPELIVDRKLMQMVTNIKLVAMAVKSS